MLETNPTIYPRFINRDYNPNGKRKGKPFGGLRYMSPAAFKEECTRLMEEAKGREKPLLYCPNGDPNVDPTGVRINMGDPAIKTVPWTNYQFPVLTEDTIAHLKLLKHQLSRKPPHSTPPPAEECPQPSPPKEKRSRSSSCFIQEVKPAYPPSFFLLSHEERIPIMKAKLAEAVAKAKAEPKPYKLRIWNGMSSQEREEAEAQLAASFKPRVWNGMSSQEPEEAEEAELAAAGIQARVKGGVSVLERPLEHLNLAAADSSGI